MMKKYTIKDIAQLAGVSKGTIDRVIHNRGNVAKDVEDKVRQLLADIDYQPNLIARNLKNNRIYQIGALLPDPKKDAYWEVCSDGIQQALSEFSAFDIRLNTFFFDPTETKSFMKHHEQLLDSAPDMILMVPLFYKEAKTVLEHYKALNMQVCTFNTQIDVSIASFIGQDLYQSGRVAAKLMHSIIEKGDMAIIHIDEKYKNAIHMQEKEKGFRSYFEDLDGFTDNILKCKIKYTETEDKLRDFLKAHPDLTGIFVTNSKAFHVARLLESENKDHIKLVGYDLLAENVHYLKDGVIDFLIHQNPRQQAYLGLKFLIENLVFEKDIPRKHLLPIDIINSENVTPFLRA